MYFVAASSIMSPEDSELSPVLVMSRNIAATLSSTAAVHTTDMYFILFNIVQHYTLCHLLGI